MIGILARKRANLTALAVLAALVAAMFIALGPAQAQTTYQVTVTTSDSDDIVTASIDTEVTIVVNASHHEGAAGGDLTVTDVAIGGPGSLTVSGAPTSGTATTQAYGRTGSSGPFSASANVGTVRVPTGTPSGTYTIEAKVDPDGTADNTLPPGNYTGTLTVGDAGTGASSVVLSAPNGTTATHSTEILVNYQVKNSLGANANNADVGRLIIEARGATVASKSGTTGIDASALTSTSGFLLLQENATVSGDEVGAKGSFSVQINREAIVNVEVDLGGASEPATLELAFTGNPETVSLGAPSGPLESAGGEITVEAKAQDKSGTDVTFDGTGLVLAIKDRSGSDPTVEQKAHQKGDLDGDGCEDGSTKADGTLNQDSLGCDSTNNPDRNSADATAEETFDRKTAIITVKTSDTAAKAGEYTLVVRYKGVSQEVPFHVSGDAHSLTASVDADGPVAVGDEVTVTVNVVDKDGVPVKDDTEVTFTAVGELSLVTAANLISTTADTDEGTASTTYIVSKGSGTGIITVRVVDTPAAGRVTVSTGSDTAMMDDEASIGCLKNLSAFSSWTCEVESSASEVFGWLADRGASALHLHNGATWVRYSVVDGGLVPGSSDFTITEGDILYISN